MLDSGPVISSRTPIRTGLWSGDCASAPVTPTAPRSAATAMTLAHRFIFPSPLSLPSAAHHSLGDVGYSRTLQVEETSNRLHERSLSEKLRAFVELVRLKEERDEDSTVRSMSNMP